MRNFADTTSQVNPSLAHPETEVTPLIAACRRGYAGIVEDFLYVEVDDLAVASDGKTALHVVCENRDSACLERFCANSKYKERNVAHLINVRDKAERTALMLLCRHKIDNHFLQEVEELIESGCRTGMEYEDIICLADWEQRTCLHHLLINNVETARGSMENEMCVILDW